MCGIFGEISKSQNCIRRGVAGVKSLEHRGYDSMGMVYPSDGGVYCVKIACPKQDRSANALLEKISFPDAPCSLVLGHTRWATHGEVNELNSHPHCYRRTYIVHNGNVINVDVLKSKLNNKDLYSETDSEVLVRYIDEQFGICGDMIEAINRAYDFVQGSQSFVVFNEDFPTKLFCANKGGSLLLGKTKDSVIVASDPVAFTSYGLKRNDLCNVGYLAVVDSDSWRVAEKKEGGVKIDTLSDEGKGDHKHYMLKEILEQPQVVLNGLSGRIDLETGNAHLGGLYDVSRDLRKVETFHFVGCGTAYNACLYAVSLLNRFGIDARAWVASEYIYNHPYIKSEDAFVFVSQSGETADTIEVIKEIKTKGNICLGIVNAEESRIASMTDAGIYIRAGSEKSVASTKAFMGMMTSLLLFSVFVARQRKMTIGTGVRILKEAQNIPKYLSEILSNTSRFVELSKILSKYNNHYIMGRGLNFATAQEGSIKLKESTYLHAEAIPLGEMKHGPLALIDKSFFSIVIVPNDLFYKESCVNIREIQSRRGPVLAITSSDSKHHLSDHVVEVPSLLSGYEFLYPFLTPVPLQLMSYYTALECGINPDKPRNLAKSVTVN